MQPCDCLHRGLQCGARAGAAAARRQQDALFLLQKEVEDLQGSLEQQTSFNGLSLTSCNIQQLDWSKNAIFNRVPAVMKFLKKFSN